MKPRGRVVLLVVLLGLAPGPAFPWSGLGHRLVGELAASRLTPQARAQVARLLAGETKPTLGGVATWADELRSSDPQRFKATSAWHYINPPDGVCAIRLERDCP